MHSYKKLISLIIHFKFLNISMGPPVGSPSIKVSIHSYSLIISLMYNCKVRLWQANYNCDVTCKYLEAVFFHSCTSKTAESYFETFSLYFCSLNMNVRVIFICFLNTDNVLILTLLITLLDFLVNFDSNDFDSISTPSIQKI